jgi:hypothetical protein
MIEEYKLNYEVALARKAKLHCHPAEAYDFAWKNGFYNLNELVSVSSKIASHYGIDAGDLWDASRSSTKNKKDARSHVVYFLMAMGFNHSAKAKILGVSIPTIKWCFSNPPKEVIVWPGKMRIFDNA